MVSVATKTEILGSGCPSGSSAVSDVSADLSKTTASTRFVIFDDKLQEGELLNDSDHSSNRIQF
jgi:hypothetical protein